MTSPSIKRGRRERLCAWLATGPIGHLYSMALDVAMFWLAQLRHRKPQAPTKADQSYPTKAYQVVPAPEPDQDTNGGSVTPTAQPRGYPNDKPRL
jgi:hypothetical protein